jgi:hypothetical protein
MNNENYITKDFNLAGYLLFEGYKLIDHPRTNGVTMFTFEDDGSIKVSLQKYYSMEALIEPIGFGNALRTLKSVLHSYDKINANVGENNYVQHNKGITRK